MIMPSMMLFGQSHNAEYVTIYLRNSIQTVLKHRFVFFSNDECIYQNKISLSCSEVKRNFYWQKAAFFIKNILTGNYLTLGFNNKMKKKLISFKIKITYVNYITYRLETRQEMVLTIFFYECENLKILSCCNSYKIINKNA